MSHPFFTNTDDVDRLERKLNRYSRKYEVENRLERSRKGKEEQKEREEAKKFRLSEGIHTGIIMIFVAGLFFSMVLSVSESLSFDGNIVNWYWVIGFVISIIIIAKIESIVNAV